MIKRNNMKLTAMSLVIGLALLSVGNTFAATGVTAQTTTSAEAMNLSTEVANLEVSFGEEDYYTDWSSEEVTTIKLGATSQISGTGAEVNGSVVTITSAGTYVLSGTLSDGQVVVAADKKDVVRLVLNGVSIHSSTTSPIFVKKASKVVLSLEAGTENSFSDTSNYVFEEGEDEPDATIYSKGDLTVNGTGTLKIKANYGDALVSKDDLRIIEGNFVIESADDGIRGKDSVAITGGTFDITAEGDGIKSTNDTDETKGFIYVEDGAFNIQAACDGFQAETSLEIFGGTFNLVTGGGAEKAAPHVDSNRGGKMGTMSSEEDFMTMMKDKMGAKGEVVQAEGIPVENAEGIPPTEKPSETPANGSQSQMPTAPSAAGEIAEETTEASSVSSKALKAGQLLLVHGGSFNMDACDDAIHTNQKVVINGGNFIISTGDDGIHGDEALIINGGNIAINKSYEGLEAKAVTINAGEMNIVASDDGINAAAKTVTSTAEKVKAEAKSVATSQTAKTAETSSVIAAAGETGKMMSGNKANTEGVAITINGGQIYISAGTDGLDANGNIFVNGGLVIIGESANNGGDSALDSDASCELTGGTVVIMSGAASGASNTSHLNSISMTFSSRQEANSPVAILDESGNLVMAVQPSKTYQSIGVYSAEFKEGESYSLSYGGTVSGTSKNGVYEAGTYTGGTKVADFTLTEKNTYLNESGLTEASTQNMGGKGGRTQAMKNLGNSSKEAAQ